MTTKDEALKLALESITKYLSECPDPSEEAVEGLCDAASAARKALAAPVQEPVANASAWFALVMNAAAELEDASHCLRDEDAKRVAISGAKHYRDAANALHTTSPAAQRPWVGLTDEEIIESAGIDGADTWLFETAYAIEAKLKAKNSP